MAMAAEQRPDRGANLAQTLRRSLGPDSIVHGGLHDSLRDLEPWNTASAELPLARVECRSAEEIASALQIAAAFDVPVTVAGARYDINGRNSRATALVVDLRQMDFVHYDSSRGIVEIGGGVSGARLLSRLPADVVVPTPAHSSIGLIGATIGGGYGPLSSNYGLLCDNLVSAQVILASSKIVLADADNNRDLFWAIKGGGNGYGVIASATFTTHTLSQLLYVQLMLPLGNSVRALEVIQTLLDTYPVQLNIEPLLLQPPGQPGVCLVIPFYWKGPEARGRAALQPLLDIPGTIVAADKFGPYRDILDVAPPRGRHYVLETVTIRRFTPESINSMVESAKRIPPIENGFGYIFLHDFHGRATTYRPKDAAFSLREPHYVIAASGGVSVDNARGYDLLTKWARDTVKELARGALPGGYINQLKPDEMERVEAYFGANAERLRDIKRAFDPEDRFRYGTGRLAAIEN